MYKGETIKLSCFKIFSTVKSISFYSKQLKKSSMSWYIDHIKYQDTEDKNSEFRLKMGSAVFALSIEQACYKNNNSFLKISATPQVNSYLSPFVLEFNFALLGFCLLQTYLY